MSIFLTFMGLDLISHNSQHILESLREHESHSPHAQTRVSPGSVDLASLLAIISTLISAVGLRNHARIGKAMRFALIESLPSVLSNPSHFLTLSCSGTMLILPLLSVKMYVWLDRLLCGVTAIAMCVLGFKFSYTQGLMLLMSHSGQGISDVMREIQCDPLVISIEEAKFWQVHYGLCIANLKIQVRGGNDDALIRLRERISSLIRNKLGGGYGTGAAGQRWEVSTQMTVEPKRLN